MSTLVMDTARMMYELPADDQRFAYEIVKKLTRLWNPGFFNSKPEERDISREELLEQIEDLELMLEVEKRLEESDGTTIPFEEVLAKHGITQEDLDSMEDVEFE